MRETDKFIYLDLETTGLRYDVHDVVEVAWARWDGAIHRFVPEHTLTDASPKALDINGYYRRGLDKASRVPWTAPAGKNLHAALEGKTIVGANPWFDTRFLYAKYGDEPWHHRLLDLPIYAAGLFGWPEQRGFYDTINHMNALGFKLPTPDHTAAGDVHAARELHEALRKLAEIRRYVDDNVLAQEILKGHTDHEATLVVGDVMRRHPRRRRQW